MRHVLLAALLFQRQREITDTLVELLNSVVLRQAGALLQQDAAAASGVLASASFDAVVHNPFTNHEGPLCLAILDLTAH